MLPRRPFRQPERPPREYRTPKVEAALFRPPVRVGDTVVATPKAPAPVRSRPHRMAVASLPCFHCRREGCSQAAHPNSGKAKGRKASDLDCFPMCSVAGGDCHARFDQYRIVAKGAEMQAYEREAKAWTVRELLRRGLWIASLPMPDIRSFNA